jgi:hypothetical protein
MGVMTLEGVVDHGQIKLKTDVQLPDNTKVYVIVPEVQVEKTARIHSPSLADPRQAADFTMEVTEEASSAGL